MFWKKHIQSFVLKNKEGTAAFRLACAEVRTLPDLPPVPECFRQRTMGEILFGHHAYGLTLPRIRSGNKISLKIVVKQISKLILSLSFIGWFHAILQRFSSKDPGVCALYGNSPMGEGYPDSQDWGDGIEGLPFMSWSPCYISWISLYTSIFKKKKSLFTWESLRCIYQILECFIFCGFNI